MFLKIWKEYFWLRKVIFKYEVSRFCKIVIIIFGYWDYFKLVKVFYFLIVEFWIFSNVFLLKMWFGINDGKYIGYVVNWIN